MVKNLSRIMMFKLMDLHDWHQIRQGSFKKVHSKFNIRESLNEISEMMVMRADIKNIKFEIDTNIIVKNGQ